MSQRLSLGAVKVWLVDSPPVLVAGLRAMLSPFADRAEIAGMVTLGELDSFSPPTPAPS